MFTKSAGLAIASLLFFSVQLRAGEDPLKMFNTYLPAGSVYEAGLSAAANQQKQPIQLRRGIVPAGEMEPVQYLFRIPLGYDEAFTYLKKRIPGLKEREIKTAPKETNPPKTGRKSALSKPKNVVKGPLASTRQARGKIKKRLGVVLSEQRYDRKTKQWVPATTVIFTRLVKSR